MAASLPFTDRVFRPFPVLSPFPLAFPHRVVSATAVQPPLARRASTVLSVSLPFFYRVATNLVPRVYRCCRSLPLCYKSGPLIQIQHSIPHIKMKSNSNKSRKKKVLGRSTRAIRIDEQQQEEGREGRARTPTPPPRNKRQQQRQSRQPQTQQHSDSEPEPEGEEEEASQQSSHPASQGRREKKSFSLTEEQERLMVEWLTEEDYIWDNKKTNYRRRDLKDARWQEISAKLGVPVDHLKGWWAAIRDQWTRFHHPKSGQAAPIFTERQQWIIQSFDFLKRVVRHRPQSVRPVSTYVLLFHNFIIQHIYNL